MDIKKEWIESVNEIGKGQVNTVAETDLVLPENAPDMEKVLYTEGGVQITNAEVQNDRVVVYGTMELAAVYCGVGGTLKRVTTKTNFTDVSDVPGAAPNMQSYTFGRVSKVEHRILNGRKLALKATAHIVAFVMEEKTVELVQKIEDERVEQKRNSAEYVQLCGRHQKNFEIKETVEVAREHPPIYEILHMEGKLNNQNVKIVNGKAIVQADLDATVLYVDDISYKPCCVSFSVPFTEILELDGMQEDWIFLQKLNVCGFQYGIDTDEHGEMRLIHFACHVESNGKMLKKATMEYMEDCFGVGQTLDMVCEPTEFLMDKGEMSREIGIRGQMDLNDMPAFSKLCGLHGEVKVNAVIPEEGAIAVQGTVQTELLYITEDEANPICRMQKEIPFREVFPCGNNGTAEFFVYVNGLSYTLNDQNGIDVRGNLEFKGILLQKQVLSVVRAVSVSENASSTDIPSVTVCFVSSKDSLWDIAKRYGTTRNAILTANDLSETDTLSGKRLIVPKK